MKPLVVLSLSLLTCCKPRSESKALHTDNEPVRSADAWQWEEVSVDDYLKIVAPPLGYEDPDQFIWDSNDDLVKRAQYWVSAIDSRLRKDNAAALTNVPKPKVIILKDETANAFVSPINVCIDMKVRLNPEIEVSQGQNIDIVALGTDGFAWPESNDSPCFSKAMEPEVLDRVVQWFNQNNKKCLLRVTKDNGTSQLVVPSNCGMDPSLSGVSLAKKVSVTTTANWITVNTGLFSQFPDKEWMIVPTLAHELGHYYRSHMTTFDSQYGFFYKLAKANTSQKPVSDSSLKDQGEMTVQAARFLEMPKLVSGQTYHVGVYGFATKVIRRLCERRSKDCKGDCSALDQKIKNGTYANIFGDLPDDEFPADHKNEYLDFERKLAQCASRVEVTSGLESHGVSRKQLASGLDGMEKILKPLRGNRFSDQINDLNTQLVNLESSAKAAVDKAEQEGLVRYSIEMEADEFGLEQFVKLGFAAHRSIESEFVFGRSDDPSAPGNKEIGECEAAYKAGWKTASGQSYIPPRGGYFEPHPNACFRIFNSWREIEAHRYSTTDRSPPGGLGSPQWSHLVGLAKTFRGTSSSSGAATKVRWRKMCRKN